MYQVEGFSKEKLDIKFTFLPTEGASDAGDWGSQVESFQAVPERVQKQVV